MLRLYDTLEQERTGRWKNRYIVDHNFHARDLKGDHIRDLPQVGFMPYAQRVEVHLSGISLRITHAYLAEESCGSSTGWPQSAMRSKPGVAMTSSTAGAMALAPRTVQDPCLHHFEACVSPQRPARPCQRSRK